MVKYNMLLELYELKNVSFKIRHVSMGRGGCVGGRWVFGRVVFV